MYTPTDIRNISAEINLLPTVHGSSLFLRGETQVLNVTTLGMSRLEQMLDTIDTVTSKDICIIIISLHIQQEKLIQ